VEPQIGNKEEECNLDSPANKEDQDQALFSPGIIAYKCTCFFLVLSVIGTECEGQQSEQYLLLTTANPQAPHFQLKRLCVVIMKTKNFEQSRCSE
jgi:hypothetical protein